MGVLKIGVVGAGIVGVTTALRLQSEYRNAEITALADKFNRDTTSDGAAGIFRPGTSFSAPDSTKTKEWIADSYSYYDRLLAENCGVKEISGYIFSSINSDMVKNHLLEDIVPVYRAADEEELGLCPGDWKYGSYFQTLLIECRSFLPWALNRFENDGGIILKESIASFSELYGRFDVVVNCTGLGAKYLCGDNKLVAIRGQVMKVSAPWLKNFYYGDYDTYIIPGSGGLVTVGGSRHYDSYRTTACRHDGAAIMERAVALVPSLSSAPVVATWVGLRPHRDPVRVEPQIVSGVKVVHNYGHGGYGVTTAPGTAKHAAELVTDMISSRSKL